MAGNTHFRPLILLREMRCPEQLIPDDKHHTHVLIQVRYVAGVMNAVVRGRNQNSFHPAWQLAYALRMHQYPISLSNGINKEDIGRVES